MLIGREPPVPGTGLVAINHIFCSQNRCRPESDHMISPTMAALFIAEQLQQSEQL